MGKPSTIQITVLVHNVHNDVHNDLFMANCSIRIKKRGHRVFYGVFLLFLRFSIVIYTINSLFSIKNEYMFVSLKKAKLKP